MNWQEVCDRSELQNLPYKIELDARGKIVMSPNKVYHSALQGEIAALLRAHKRSGKILTECAIHTRQGTKVADVAWVSDETYERIKDEAACPVAPEICMEILSSSNTEEEISEKRALYFEQGAQEFWLCDQNGRLAYFDPAGEVARSTLCPDFPRKTALDA